MELHEIFLVLGGLGLFLYGMKLMSTAIETAAGDKLQMILQKATANRFFAVTVGVIATIALNSSTAVTIMTVSFVNSGMMTLKQAIGIIMGANLGTTFSAQLVAFRLDTWAPLFIFIGIIMHLFLKKKRLKNIGLIILGFGILFFGIGVMGGPLRELARTPAFENFLTTFSNPFLALLAGFAFTAVVNSSSATMGILVALHLSGAPIPFETSAFIILGTNIGTSITTVIASIPASRESKRAALFHIMFDIIGSTVFGVLLFLVPAILGWFEATWTEPARQVAMFHTLYNLATLLLILPFIGPVAKLMEKIVPLKKDDTDVTSDKQLKFLDFKLRQHPAVVMQNAHLELARTQKIANKTLAIALESFYEKSADKAAKTIKNKKLINTLSRKISAEIVKINNKTITQSDAKKIGKMFRILYNIERIGDHAENISEYATLVIDSELKFPAEALDELRQFGDVTLDLAAKSLYAFENQDASLLSQIEMLEEKADELTARFTENHIVRVTSESIDARSSVVFTDMIVDLERTADHSNDIATIMFAPNKPKKKQKKQK
ncbi:MAG: Na/Pi cotransporter family protein [Defluviitaleaceae bacterium]|nr:Na/Pi cotransporter family protein [Defluviitaleaceae bacterium]